MKRWNVVLVLGAMVFAMARCGGDDGGSTGATPDPDEGKDPVKQTITAAEGGTIATASGKASIEIPAGALADDTEISIEVLAKDAATETNVYEFGPDGQQFQKAVTIALAYDGEPGTEKKAVLAYFDVDSGKWKEVPNSGLVAGKVAGDVNHFTKFSIIIVDDKLVAVSDCADIVAGWQPCGGDPVGTWSLKDICFENVVVGEVPGISEICADARVDAEYTWDGEIDIKSDGTAVMDMRSMSAKNTFVIPTSCLSHPQINLADCAALAAMLSDDDETVTCTEKSDACECPMEEKTEQMSDGPQTGTWSVDGNNFTFNETGSDEPAEATPYCIEGGLLSVKVNMDGTPVVMVWE